MQHNHTPQQIQYRNECIRQAYTNPDLKQKVAQSVTQAFKDPVKKRNLSDGQKRGWNNEDRKRRQAEHAIRLQALGKIGPQAPFKTEWKHNPFTGKSEYMHSSWEVAFLDRCIREGYPVTKEHGIVIDYQQEDGTWHRYLPDFKSLEEKVLFEVKGVMTDNDELKLKAAEALGYQVVLIQDAND